MVITTDKFRVLLRKTSEKFGCTDFIFHKQWEGGEIYLVKNGKIYYKSLTFLFKNFKDELQVINYLNENLSTIKEICQ